MQDRSTLSWSTWPEAARLFVTGRTRRPALVVCLAVGTLLTVVHQGPALVAGDLGGATLARVAFNYALPYLVSSIGVLSACRTSPHPPG